MDGIERLKGGTLMKFGRREKENAKACKKPV
jgi:hypothetical protein